MEKEFIPYELALRMKQLGFDEPCFAWYYGKDLWIVDQEESKPMNYRQNPIRGGNGILAPLYQQAFRWFREKHFYISYVCAPYKEHDEFYFRIRHIGDVINEGQLESCESQVYKSYEEAELACIEKLIEIVEQSKSE